MGSVLWVLWVLLTTIPGPAFSHLREGYEAMHVTWWAVLFAMHSVIGSYTLLTNSKSAKLALGSSILGVLAWTSSTIIITTVRLNEGGFPMGGAHWMAMIIAWWIFLRDCVDPYYE